MEEHPLHDWPERRLKTDAGLSILTAVGALLGGLFVTFLTFWLTYVLLYVAETGVDAALGLFLSKHIEITHSTRCWMAMAFMILLFVTWLRTDPHYCGESTDENCSPFLPGSGTTAALVQMAAHPKTSARMIVDLLLTGPRLIGATREYASRGRRFREANLEHACALFHLLWARNGAVAWEELDVQGLSDTARHLTGFSGLVYLNKGPSLTSDLREELTAVVQAGV